MCYFIRLFHRMDFNRLKWRFYSREQVDAYEYSTALSNLIWCVKRMQKFKKYFFYYAWLTLFEICRNRFDALGDSNTIVFPMKPQIHVTWNIKVLWNVIVAKNFRNINNSMKACDVIYLPLKQIFLSPRWHWISISKH